MNPEPKPFADAADEREWRAQERARAAQRDANVVVDDDAARYRDVVRALGALPRVELADDFARELAARVAAHRTGSVHGEPALAAFERGVVSVLVVIFVAAVFGAAMLVDVGADVARVAGPAFASGWLWLGLAGLAATAAISRPFRMPRFD